MNTNLKINKPGQIKLYELPKTTRSGGEQVPLNYPQLHQIRAGDWRISYAVEHNRLAILVLEILSPEDAARESVTQKIKVKLLELKEQTAGKKVTAQEVERRIKIKLSDITDGLAKKEASSVGTVKKSRIKLQISPAVETSQGQQQNGMNAKRKITILDSTAASEDADFGKVDEEPVAEEVDTERKVTPVDEPSS